ncbi:MAG: phage baseplate upper protein [Clostridia bacterium]|nr:phage baseplate upper protein [Clostridia bacterium]
MTTLRFTASGERLTADRKFFITSGNINTAQLVIALSDEWLSFSSFFLSIWGKDENIYKVPAELANGKLTVSIPAEILQFAQVVSFGIYAENADGACLTSSVVTFTINQGTPTDGIKPADWLKFKADIIAVLNENFESELEESATTEEVLEALNAVEITKVVKTELVDAINEHFQTSFSADDDIHQIINELAEITTAENERAAIIVAYNQKFAKAVPETATRAEFIADMMALERIRIIDSTTFYEGDLTE